MPEKIKRFGFVLRPREKAAIKYLAEKEGGLSQAALIRRLIREAAVKCGLWSAATTSEEQEAEVQK
jgi:hypothetical protein